MSRYIDADALIADMQERYCKPCKERKEDYNEVRCRACWVDDAMDEVDGFGDNGIDIVRCQDCKHEDDCEHEVLLSEMWGEIEETAHITYCSYGERRSDE